MASIVSSGTVTTDGTEQTIATDGGTAFYVATLEASALANADQITLRLKSGATSGGTVRPGYEATYWNAQGTASLKISPPMPCAGTVIYTIKAGAGGNRSYAWALWKI